MKIEYAQVGDYLLPLLTLTDLEPDGLAADAPPLGYYGVLNKVYLLRHKTITYNQLLLSGQLYPHLHEVQQTAHERIDSIMADMLIFNPPPDKAADGLAWAAHMADIHRVAEKMMLDEIVYV